MYVHVPLIQMYITPVGQETSGPPGLHRAYYHGTVCAIINYV